MMMEEEMMMREVEYLIRGQVLEEGLLMTMMQMPKANRRIECCF
jgi:hypothetical protein